MARRVMEHPGMLPGSSVARYAGEWRLADSEDSACFLTRDGDRDVVEVLHPAAAHPGVVARREVGTSGDRVLAVVPGDRVWPLGRAVDAFAAALAAKAG